MRQMVSGQGQVLYYRSAVDGKLQPYAVCATDTTSNPKPLILEVSPGAILDLDAAAAKTQQIVTIAANAGLSCVALRPTGRGPGTIYQNYGEVDVLEAIEDTARHFAIDRDRISITGASMGGAATWYLISHYPDLFAAAAPFCGYCDYRLWEKPGGLTFHMHPWEEPSWQSRSAILLAENLRNLPVWIVHGQWDRAVGGGVPVEHSRQMAITLDRMGIGCKYTEVPETGHGIGQTGLYENVIQWLLTQQRTPCPDHVTMATFGLRHNKAYWVTIEQLCAYGQRGIVDGELRQSADVYVRTENVRTMSLGPLGAGRRSNVTIDGQTFDAVELADKVMFQKSADGQWACGEFDLSQQKRHRVGGPIGDLFFDGVVIVPGTTGSKEQTHFNQLLASPGNLQRYYNQHNGGVHRGGIAGENRVQFEVVADVELSETQVTTHNLLLLGTKQSNAIIGRYGDRLPMAFQDTGIRICDRTFEGKQVAAFAVMPHPDNSDRYVAVHGGTTPDAICWGSHLHLNLLPDYIVYNGANVLEWGFWDSQWKSPAPLVGRQSAEVMR